MAGESQNNQGSQSVRVSSSSPLPTSIDNLQLSTRKLSQRLDRFDQIMVVLLETIKSQAEETVGFLSEQMTALSGTGNPAVSKDILHMLTINFNTEKKVSKLLVQLENMREATSVSKNELYALNNEVARFIPSSQTNTGEIRPSQSGYNSDTETTSTSQQTPVGLQRGSQRTASIVPPSSASRTKTAASMKPKRTSRSMLESVQHSVRDTRLDHVPEISETSKPVASSSPLKFENSQSNKEPALNQKAQQNLNVSNKIFDKTMVESISQPNHSKSKQNNGKSNEFALVQKKDSVGAQNPDQVIFSDSEEEIVIKSEEHLSNQADASIRADTLNVKNNTNQPQQERTQPSQSIVLASQHRRKSSQGNGGSADTTKSNQGTTQNTNNSVFDSDSESELSSLSNDDLSDFASDADIARVLQSDFRRSSYLQKTNRSVHSDDEHDHEESAIDGEEKANKTSSHEGNNKNYNPNTNSIKEKTITNKQLEPSKLENTTFEVEEDIESVPRIMISLPKKSANHNISPYDDYVRYYRLLPRSYLESHQKVTKPPSDGVTRYENGNVVLFQNFSASTLRALCLVSKNHGKFSPFENDSNQEKLITFVDELIKLRTKLQAYVTEESKKVHRRLSNSTTIGSFTSANADRSTTIPLLKCIDVKTLDVSAINLDLLISGLSRSIKGPTWSAEYCVCNRIIGYCTSLCPCMRSKKAVFPCASRLIKQMIIAL